MAISHELAVGRQQFERLALPRSLITINAGQDGRVEDEKTAVNVGIIPRRLLNELSDPVTIK